MVKNLDLDNFEKEIVDSEIPVLIDFYADWCGPCQLMKPVFERLEKNFEGKVSFLKLDTQTESGLAMKFGIQGIPAFVMISKGKEIVRFVGYMNEEDFTLRIKQVLDLL